MDDLVLLLSILCSILTRDFQLAGQNVVFLYCAKRANKKKSTDEAPGADHAYGYERASLFSPQQKTVQ